MLEKEIEKLMPHIKWTAKKYSGLGVSVEDLIQEGVFGVFKAKDHYDLSLGVHFNIYAIWWIKQSILEALSTQSKLVHLPFIKINLYRKIKKFQDLYVQKHEREASDLEIKNELQISSKELYSTLHSNAISIDQPVVENENITMSNILVTEDTSDIKIEKDHLKVAIKAGLNKLTTREQFVIKSYFGIDCESMSLENISKKLKLTKERCRQIKQESLAKMKNTVSAFF